MKVLALLPMKAESERVKVKISGFSEINPYSAGFWTLYTI